MSKLETITINELFLTEPIFKCCFCCGEKEYEEFYFKDHLYRLCNVCIDKNHIKKFFNDQIK